MRQPLYGDFRSVASRPVERRHKARDWWDALDISARQREKIRADFTITRDGYAIWYKGQKRAVCGKSVPPDQVHARWDAKRYGIDKVGRPVARILAPNTYRQILA